MTELAASRILRGDEAALSSGAPFSRGHFKLTYLAGIPVRRGELLLVCPDAGHTADPRARYLVRVTGRPGRPIDRGAEYARQRDRALTVGGMTYESWSADPWKWTWAVWVGGGEAGVLTREVEVEIVGRVAVAVPPYSGENVRHDW